MTAKEKQQRIVDAATALLGASPDRTMNIVQLNKALFYLDLAALRDEGETVTGSSYVALEQGPVLAKYQRRLVRPLEKAGLAKQEEGPNRTKPVRLLDEPAAAPSLTPHHLELVRKVAEWARRKSSTVISDLSHDNPGWRLAYEQGRKAGRPARPINMLVAMQQLADDDPWMDEPPDEEFQAAVDRAERREGLEAW